MEIKLNKDFKVKAVDDLNYVLYRKTDKSKTPKHLVKKEDGEDGWKVLGYYSKFEQLAEEILELEIKLSDAKSFKQVLEKIARLKLSWKGL